MCFVRKLNISFLHVISRFVCKSDYISFCRLYIFQGITAQKKSPPCGDASPRRGVSPPKRGALHRSKTAGIGRRLRGTGDNLAAFLPLFIIMCRLPLAGLAKMAYFCAQIVIPGKP